MNKTRILGIALLIIGLLSMYLIENDLGSFAGGVFVGIGAAMTIVGKTIFSKKTT